MRIYLELTKSIYFCISVYCNCDNTDGMDEIHFKLADGRELIVYVPAGEYDRVIRPRLLRDGYYAVNSFYSSDIT